MKNILITGGAGFIGSNLALKLIKKGYSVTVLDSLSPQIHGENPMEESPLYRSIVDKVCFIHGNVTERSIFSEAMEGQDAVIHLAAETGTGQSMYQIQRYVDVNMGGTGILLDILANSRHTVKKVIVASSRAIYGEGRYHCAKHGMVFPNQRIEADLSAGDFSCKCPFCHSEVEVVSTTEDSMIHPTSVYGITKQSQEQLVMTVCASLGLPSVAFRYQNVYGPGQSLSNPYTGILSIFSTRILNHKDIELFEDGKESRDFVYIDDVVESTIRGLELDEANYKVINIGTAVRTDVNTVANELISHYKSKSNIHVSGNYRLGDIRHNMADCTMMNRCLQYKPEWDFKKGIAAFTAWVAQQTVKEDRYEESINEMKIKGLYK